MALLWKFYNPTVIYVEKVVKEMAEEVKKEEVDSDKLLQKYHPKSIDNNAELSQKHS